MNVREDESVVGEERTDEGDRVRGRQGAEYSE